MDLGLLYSNFVMDKKDLTLLSSPDAHLASCTKGDDDSIPLMAAETFPRLQGGIGSSLMEWRK